jgi:hypothetical protein
MAPDHGRPGPRSDREAWYDLAVWLVRLILAISRNLGA